MRLAERSLGVGEVVRARTASLFEASPAAEPLELAEEREVAPAPRRAERRRESVAMLTPRDESPSPPALEVVVEREAEAARAEQPSPASSEELPAAPAPPAAEQATEPPSPARGAERDSPPEAPPPPTVVVRDRRPAVRTKPRAHEPVSGSEPQGQVGSSLLVLPLSPPAPERVAARPPAADEPPVVRVTIGRVDVRAVLPAAPAERARPKRPPRLTLDEYLRGGEHR